jgi:hypothetical protein
MRRRYTVYGATVAEVIANRDTLRAELGLGRPVDARREAERLTVAAYLDRWLETKRDIRPQS